MTRSRALLAVLALAAATAVAGCGDSEEKSSGDSKADSGCDGTRLVFTDKASGDTATMEQAAAVSLAGGSAYTIYATDFDLSTDSLSAVSAPTVPADGTMATIALTVFNATGTPDPIEAGTTIRYTDDFGVLTFRALQNQGDTVLGSSTNAAGSVSVDAVGDTVCIGIDYSDDEKSYSGIVEAAVKPL